MKKILFVLVILLVVLLVGVYLARNVLAKRIITQGVHSMTGLKVSLKNIHLGILESQVKVEGLVLYNPESFKDRVMVDMPELFVQYDLGALLTGKVRLPAVRLDLKECMVVKNSDGSLNLKTVSAAKPKGKAPAREEKAEAARAPEFMIDSLDLKIGKVGYKDYSSGDPAQSYEFNANINRHFEDIDSSAKLVQLIMFEVLRSGTLAQLTGFDISGLQQNLGGTLEGSIPIEKSRESFEEMRKSTEETLKKKADELKKLFGPAE